MTRLTLNQFRIMNVGVWLGYLMLTTNFLSAEWAGRPEVKSAVAAMAQRIPMLDSIRAIPGVNDWIRTFYAGVWLLAPFFVASGWYMRRQECREKKERARNSSDVVLFLNGALFYGVGIWMMFLWPISDANGWRDRAVAGAFGLAYTTVVMYAVFFCWGATARWLYSRIRFGHVNEYLAKPKHN